MEPFTTKHPEFKFNPLTPYQQTLPWFSRCGRIKLIITNTSSSALFNLEATDQAGSCQFELMVPTKQLRATDSLNLPVTEGETVQMIVEIRPPVRPIFGMRMQPYLSALTLTKLSESCPRQTIVVQLNGMPLITPIIMVILVLLSCLGLIYLRPAGTTPLPSPATPTRVQIQTTFLLPPAYLSFNQSKAELALTTPEPTPNAILAARDYYPIFKAAAETYHLDWQILARQAYRESRLNPKAVGRFQETGLMQIRPSTWQEWASKVGGTDPFDPQSNVEVAAAYLAFLKEHFNQLGYSDYRWSLAAYNWGPNNLSSLLKQGGNWSDIPAATRQYVTDVLAQEEEWVELFPVMSQWKAVNSECKLNLLVHDQHISASGSYTETETMAAGPPLCRIERDSCQVHLLVGNLDPSIVFKNEEEPSYQEDFLMHPAMLMPLYRLNQLVQAEWGGAVKLRVTDTYDSLLEHDLGQAHKNKRTSLHFEGRSIDLTTWPIEPERYGRLCILAHCAGFDWVQNEGDHCHASVLAESLCGRC